MIEAWALIAYWASGAAFGALVTYQYMADQARRVAVDKALDDLERALRND